MQTTQRQTTRQTTGRTTDRTTPQTRRRPPGRRAHRRRRIDLPFHAARLSGRVIDWSRGGLAVESESGLRIGARYALTVHSATRSRRLRGTVRWCALRRTRRTGDEVRPVYRAGIDLRA